MSTASHVNLNLQYTPSLIPQSVISLNFFFSYKYDRVIRDVQGNEAVIDSSRIPYSRFFPCQIDTQSLVHPYLFCLHLYEFFSAILNLDDAVRSRLARTIVDSLLEESYRQPLFQLVADVEIVETEFINQMETLVMVDGGYVFDDLGGGELRSVALKKLIKKGRFNYRGDGGEEECPICLENYREGTKVVKMKCLHIFHKNCIYKWLKKKDTCPLCRRSVF